MSDAVNSYLILVFIYILDSSLDYVEPQKVKKSINPLNVLNSVIKMSKENPTLNSRIEYLEHIEAAGRLDIIEKFVKLLTKAMSDFEIRLEILEDKLGSKGKEDNNEIPNAFLRTKRSPVSQLQHVPFEIASISQHSSQSKTNLLANFFNWLRGINRNQISAKHL